MTEPTSAALPRTLSPSLFLFAILYGGMVVLAGVLGNKQVALGSWLAVEAGIFAFLMLVALSSAVSELHGQSVANRIVLWGFVPLVLSIMLTALVLALPASGEMQPERLAAFDMILGQSPRLMAAGIVAYGTSQFLNVTIFSKLRGREGAGTGTTWLAIRGAIASALSQIVDTLLFVTIAFYGMFPIANLMGGQMLAKVALSVLVIPFVITGLVALGRSLDAKTPDDIDDRPFKMPDLLAKAETLVEALPYLQRYAGETFVIKYGGHAMGDPEAQRDFAEDVVLLKAVGINPVVVHGGGPQIGAMLKQLGIESTFVGGLRVTDAPTAEVAEMVLAGRINKEIVGWIAGLGGRAVGISGKDANLVLAEKVKRTEADPNSGIERHVDLGFVGEPVAVDPTILANLTKDNFIPVVAPVALGADGATYNINADTMAGAIAGALDAKRFFLLTDVAGVLDKAGALLTDLDRAAIDALKQDGTITGGMIPKVETCVAAVEAGVEAAVILDGRIPHAMLLEIFTARGAGTLIHR